MWGKCLISRFLFLIIQSYKIQSMYCELKKKMIKKTSKVKKARLLLTSIWILFVSLSFTVLRQANCRNPSLSCQSCLSPLPAPPIASLALLYCALQKTRSSSSQTNVLPGSGSQARAPSVWIASFVRSGSRLHSGQQGSHLSEHVAFHSGGHLPFLCLLGSHMPSPLSQRPQSSLRTSWMTSALRNSWFDRSPGNTMQLSCCYLWQSLGSLGCLHVDMCLRSRPCAHVDQSVCPHLWNHQLMSPSKRTRLKCFSPHYSDFFPLATPVTYITFTFFLKGFSTHPWLSSVLELTL